MLRWRIVLLCIIVVYTGDAQSTCAINPCSFPNICNGKTCILTETCEMFCTCDESSTAPECINVTASSTVTSLTSVTPVTGSDPTGCSCVNGQCVTGSNNQTKCECASGWDGDQCELPCFIQCPEGQRCVIPDPNFPSFAICQGVDLIETTTFTFTPSTDLSFNRTYNVCDPDYKVRPKSERECNGFKCLYGTCNTNSSKVWCECDPGAIGQVCQTECCRQCVYGNCFFYAEESREMCNCQANYSGPYCETWDPPTTYAPPEEVTWHYWVVGACVVVLLILLILMVAVPYVMWRNRVILVMKVVHYFQGYEDEDERQWDAFISYKSTKEDENYVVKTLFPKLEKELGFKVNVHFRDFLPGETIANNIITAVQSSRRTIMIITPSYVTSEFTKFEYQVAQQEMLKRKHRIIPILLEDITDCKETMDPNLKVILNSVTYIEWPKDGNEKKMDKFWKRIELSMPKIKNRSVESDSSNISNNGTVVMTKPEDVNISFSKDKGKSNSGISNGNTNIYSIIDEMKQDHDEVYDKLDESEMQSKVFARKQEVNGNPKHDSNLNGLKVNV